MAKWVNRVLLSSTGTGSTTETYNPNSGTVLSGAGFVPTAGRLLVAIIGGPVTSSTPTGWTLPSGGSAINNNGLYVWWKTAAGSDTAVTTHNGDGTYPTLIEFLEFPAGSTFVGSAANAVVASGAAGPTLSGLTGTNLLIGALASPNGSGNVWSWSTGVEDLDNVVGSTSPRLVELSSAYLEDSVLTSVSMTATRVGGVAAGVERLQFAVKVATGADIRTATGALTVGLAAAGSAGKIAGAAGAIGFGLAAGAADSKTGAAAGALPAGFGTAGAAAKTAPAAGALGAVLGSAGSVAKQITAAGVLGAQLAAAGQAGKSGAATGSLGAVLGADGAAGKTADVAGALPVVFTLAGSTSATDVRVATGSLGVTITAAGAAGKVGQAAGTVGFAVTLTGAGTKQGTAVGVLAVAVTLAGAGNPVRAAGGSLSVALSLAGGASAYDGEVVAVLWPYITATPNRAGAGGVIRAAELGARLQGATMTATINRAEATHD